MRDLYLTVGAPAIGKSYWIKQNHLENYTLSSDAIREVASNYASVITTSDGKERLRDYTIDYQSEHETWNLLYEALENRMKHGQTVIVDATHLFKGAFTTYNRLRIKYNYKVHLIDFMAQHISNPAELSKLLNARDQKRMRHVGTNVIEKYINRYLNSYTHFPDWLHIVTPEVALLNLQAMNSIDVTCFDTIKVVGDVHGDYGALQKVFENHHRGVAYVFVGDYLDRGTKNAATLKFLASLKGNNIFFIRGNHEWKVEQYLNTGKLRGNFRRTYPILCKELGNDTADSYLKAVQKQLVDYVFFTVHDKKGDIHSFLITHAGLEPLVMEKPFELINENDLVMGIPGDDENPYNRDIDESIANSNDKLIQIHGHRNNFDHFDDCHNSYNLTKDGKFRWVDIDTSTGLVTPHEIKSIDGAKLQTVLDDDPDVKNVELDDGIIANNFTREAFENNRWTPTTTNARGLFTRNNEVVGRGFKKFFELGQTPTSTLESLGYPVKAYVKHNGFLAISFYDKDKQKVNVFSKGGGESYSTWARQILKELGMYESLENYYDQTEFQDTSVLFEIVDPINDPHIVKYNNVHAYPLAVVNNDMAGHVRLKEAESYWGIDKWLAFTADNEEILKSKVTDWLEWKSTKEGLVLYGQNKMLKVKTPFYHKAKELRSALGHATKKRRWYYGAEEWYDRCIERGIHEFTPDLALQLYDEDAINAGR